MLVASEFVRTAFIACSSQIYGNVPSVLLGVISFHNPGTEINMKINTLFLSVKLPRFLVLSICLSASRLQA